MLIPGWVISILTFPGVIIHEMGHKFFCDILKVKVREVKYFRFGNPAGYVIHEVSDKFYKTFLIDVGPFIINSAVAILIFVILSRMPFEGAIPVVLMWLGVSIGMHAFPSSHDAKVLWSESGKHIKNGNLMAIVGFPVSIMIRIANLLAIIWFDLIYAIALYLLVVSVVPSSHSISDDTPKLFESEKCGFSINITSKWDVESEEDICYFVFDKDNHVILVYVSEGSTYDSLREFVNYFEIVREFYFTEIVEEVSTTAIFQEQLSANIHFDNKNGKAEFFAAKSNGKYYVVGYFYEDDELRELDKVYSFKVI